MAKQLSPKEPYVYRFISQKREIGKTYDTGTITWHDRPSRAATFFHGT